jgi:hypothetical protein
MAVENVNGGEREFETGKDEAWASQMFEKDSSYFANRKRTYDEFQEESLETIRQARRHAEALNNAALESINRNRTVVDKLLSDAQQADNVRQAIANQALQNAVETANMMSKQSIRHVDLAVDRQWNIDEVSDLSAKTGVQQDAIASALIAALSKALQQVAGAPAQANP